MSRLRNAWQTFFLSPASPRPLAALRIGAALVLLAQAWVLRSSVLDFMAGDGLIQGDLASWLGNPLTPKISWLAAWLAPYHVSEASCIYAVCALYVTALVFFGLGLFTRTFSVAAWFLHWVLMNTGESTNYGVDLYAHVTLFYLMWMPAGEALSIDSWRKGRFSGVPSAAARLGLRVVQLHLAISYLSSAIDKGRGEQWWNGNLLWRAFSMPVYRQFDMTWLVNWPWLSRVGGWATLLLEGGYIIFIWPRRTRKLWVAGIVGLHLGIAVFLGLGLFGVMMSLLTFCAFGLSAELASEASQSGDQAPEVGASEAGSAILKVAPSPGCE